MEKHPVKVCMISCLHGLYDDRIYWKEALSLKKHGYDVTHIGVGDKDQHSISEHGIQLIEIKNTRYFKNHFIDKFYRLIAFKPSIYKKLFQICSELQAEVYHFHDLQLNRIAPKIKKIPLQPKVIYDVHEPYAITLATTNSKNPLIKLFWLLYGRYIDYWEKSNSKNYDLIITTEENVQGFFKKKLIKTPVEIIYNYVDILPERQVIQKVYDFIYCGGIRKRRGIYEILNAINILKNRKIKSKTLIIGVIHDPGLEEEINNFIAELKLNDDIDIKSSVPYNMVADYYAISKVGLAIFNDEKVNRTIMPIKIFEYIVFGLPVITSNFGHMKELTLKNNTGILIDPSDVVELADSMEKMITDQQLYNQLADNCRNSSKNDYTWRFMESKLLQLYNNIIAN